MLKVLPGEVKAVHYREQQCAVLFWACLVFVFLAYSLYLTVQMFEQRLSPPQAVSFNDPNLVRRLDTFPNLVACFPQFGGPKVDWLPAAAIKHEWGLKNESKKEEASIILKPEACGLVSRTWNRDCLFYDGSNLTPKGATAVRRHMRLCCGRIWRGEGMFWGGNLGTGRFYAASSHDVPGTHTVKRGSTCTAPFCRV